MPDALGRPFPDTPSAAGQTAYPIPHICMRSVVRLTASATSALPRWLLLTICIVYASFGLFGRDPWKNEDAAGFGGMWTLANGTAHDWLLPNLVGKYITSAGPLGYWLRRPARHPLRRRAGAGRSAPLVPRARMRLASR